MKDIHPTEEEKELIDGHLSHISFMTHATDPNLVYYIPPFVPVEGIAGTLFTNALIVKRADRIDNEFKDVLAYYKERLTQLNESYDSIKEKLSQLPADEEFIRNNMLALLEKVTTEIAMIKKSIQNKATPDIFSAILERRLTFELGSANIKISDLDLSKSKNQLIGRARLNKSYGGMLTVNTVAGLTVTQIRALKTYKKLLKMYGKTSPKFIPFPFKKISWYPLTETLNDENQGIPPFRKVTGGGNLKGATFHADLTVSGARSLAVAPPPIVLPIGVKSVVYEKLSPFETTVNCHIESDWFDRGRSDVMDGLVIYHDALFRDMVKVTSHTGSEDSPCTISYLEGIPEKSTMEASIRKAIEGIQNKLTDLGFSRSNLAYQERRHLINAVQNDIANNHSSDANQNALFSVFKEYLAGDWKGLADGLYSQASNFFWHTDERNIKKLDAIDFQFKIKEDGNSVSEIRLPLQICIAWHSESRAFIRCTQKQQIKALSLSEAASYARNSDECQDTETSQECGEARKQEAPRDRENGAIAIPDS